MKPERQLPSHELIMSELMMPYTANFSGNVHGGDFCACSTKWHIPAPAVTAEPIALLCLLIKYCLKSLFMSANW